MCITTTPRKAATANGNGEQKKKINHVDFEQPRREHLFSLPGFATRWVLENMLCRKLEHNLAIFLVGLNISTTSLPLAALMFYCEKNDLLTTAQFVALGIFYVVFHLKVFARSFMLALHYITHCSPFNLTFRFLDHYWKSVLCCFFGIPPGLYYPHHVGMHHALDNVAPHDMSSTMDYPRGSKWSHFKYMARFVFLGSAELPYRLCQTKKYGLAAQCVTGVASFWIGTSYLFTKSPMATFFVFFMPWLICSFGLMQGNYKEHIFVDPDDPGNNYKSAMSCINAPSNALTFNTGYHIEHHEEPGLPWYKLPELFLKNLDKHAANDSLIFSGIGPMEVGTLVLNEKFEELADYYLNVGQPKRTKQQLVAEFKRRLNPVFPSKIHASSE